MELFIIIATVFKRYEFVLENPKQAVRLSNDINCPLSLIDMYSSSPKKVS
jgi:hypothetical protein